MLFIISMLSSCEKDSEKLPPALEQEIGKINDCKCLPYFAKYSWRGEIIYLRSTLGPSCFSFPRYYNKDGVKIEMEAGYTIDKFRNEATLIGIVWECLDALV